MYIINKVINMYYDDHFHPTGDNDINEYNVKALEEIKLLDKGYCKIYKHVKQFNSKKAKLTKIELYTSGCVNSNIRDAITGKYYQSKVGSIDEHLFFKISLSTGQCKSSNGSNTLFFSSPEECYSHLFLSLDPVTISVWNEKKKFYLKELKL